MNTKKHSLFQKFSVGLIGFWTCVLPSVVNASGTVTEKFTSVADTYVTNGSGGANADKNYGENPTFQTRATNHNSAHRLAYVRFDLDDLILGDVTDATLFFTHTYTTLNNATAGSTSTVSVFALNYNYSPAEGKQGLEWTETTDEEAGITGLTNNNAPWAASNSSTVPSFVTYVGSFDITLSAGSSSNLYSITGTSSTALISFLQACKDNGMNSITFILRSSTDATLSFASKESTTAPSLSVTYVSSIPEPAVYCTLVGFGALAICFYFRIRNRR